MCPPVFANRLTVYRADTSVCPYNLNNKMYVIWHVYEFITHDVFEMVFQFIEPIRNHPSRII
jgi:hypothetical protein